MGYFLTSDFSLESLYKSFFHNVEYVIYGILSLIFTTTIAFLFLILYKKIRRKFPLKVNCWFCNKNTYVSYKLFNCWDCPNCNQYNGFNKDGDYNKTIPEQFNYKLNESISKTIKASVKSNGESTTTYTNGLCKLCNINQQLKIQQLALFVPLDENNYYEEIEEYRSKLEKAYQLCSKCEKTLKQTLEKQEYYLLQNRLNSHKTNKPLENSKNLSKIYGSNFLFMIKKNGILGLKFISVILAAFLFLALIIDFETENHYFMSLLSDIVALEPVLPVLEMLLHFKEKICFLKKELSFAGLLCWLFVLFENQKKNSWLVTLAWGFLHISCWTTFKVLQILLSGACFFLNSKMAQNKFMYINKKSSFKPIRKVFPEIYNSNELGGENEHSDTMSSFLPKSGNIMSLDETTDLVENNKIKGIQKKSKNKLESAEKKKKGRQHENEVESFLTEERESSSSPNTSFAQKSFLYSPEAEKSFSESNGPFSEVFNNLSSLNIGDSQKKPKKPPNFLFANHNFLETKNSSIIKPAKFIKNFNSTSWTESNECNSRSSTPSSGYSSQKPEKIEPSRSDFPKTMTPVFVNSFGRQSASNYFEYFDGNRGFYNNMNYFNPGFVPFQHYPGPLGHAAMYTSSRPANFPFFFPPWQGYPPQKLSPVSSRFSDASDCDNLFQESRKKFEQNQKFLKFKTFLYYFSIFCNFITMTGLAYFISTGVILLDWKLPKFNFFI